MSLTTISGEHGNGGASSIYLMFTGTDQPSTQLYKINTSLTNAFAISSQTGEPSVKNTSQGENDFFSFKSRLSEKRDNIQCSPFIKLCFGSTGMDCIIRDCVISESCYKGTILQRNYRKMTI